MPVPLGQIYLELPRVLISLECVFLTAMDPVQLPMSLQVRQISLKPYRIRNTTSSAISGQFQQYDPSCNSLRCEAEIRY